MEHVREVLAVGAVRSVFQPIVDLDSGAVVAYEALARGPRGPARAPRRAVRRRPRRAGASPSSTSLCRRAAFTRRRRARAARAADPVRQRRARGARHRAARRPARDRRRRAPGELQRRPRDHRAGARHPPGRAAAHRRARPRPRLVDRARRRRRRDAVARLHAAAAAGRRQARPAPGAGAAGPGHRRDHERRQRPTPRSTGALVLAEGIETQAHLVTARALGARLGQGWLFGRPARRPGAAATPSPSWPLPAVARPPSVSTARRSTACPPGTALRRSPKALLIEVSKQLERQAMRLRRDLRGRRDLPGGTALHAVDRAALPRPGRPDRLRRAPSARTCRSSRCPACAAPTLSPDRPGARRVGPHRASARTSAPPCWPATSVTSVPDLERTFEYALTYDRDTVVARDATRCCRGWSRACPQPVARRAGRAGGGRRGRAGGSGLAARHRRRGAAAPGAGRHARAGSRSPTSTSPTSRWSTSTSAFAATGGLPRRRRPRAATAGSCRAPTPTPPPWRGSAARIAAGEECRETLLNYRGPERTPWWNEVYLSPVVDEDGRVVQYIGVQNDVTARVEAERALALERDRRRELPGPDRAARVHRPAHRAWRTGAAVEERLEVAMWDARAAQDAALAVLFLDLDGFKQVNDAARPRRRRRSCSSRRPQRLSRPAAPRRPARPPRRRRVPRRPERTRVRRRPAPRPAGWPTRSRPRCRRRWCSTAAPCRSAPASACAVYPADATDLRGLLHAADLRMYDAKRRLPQPGCRSRSRTAGLSTFPTVERGRSGQTCSCLGVFTPPSRGRTNAVTAAGSRSRPVDRLHDGDDPLAPHVVGQADDGAPRARRCDAYAPSRGAGGRRDGHSSAGGPGRQGRPAAAGAGGGDPQDAVRARLRPHEPARDRLELGVLARRPALLLPRQGRPHHPLRPRVQGGVRDALRPGRGVGDHPGRAAGRASSRGSPRPCARSRSCTGSGTTCGRSRCSSRRSATTSPRSTSASSAWSGGSCAATPSSRAPSRRSGRPPSTPSSTACSRRRCCASSPVTRRPPTTSAPASRASSPACSARAA